MSGRRILHRAIFTHLLVALPPALAIGWVVIEVNRNALLVETHHTEIAVASRMKDAIVHALQSSRASLGTAERILDAPELAIEVKKDLLRALVADADAQVLALYTSDGARDSVFDVKGSPAMPESIAEPLRIRLRGEARVAGEPFLHEKEMWLPLFIRWERDGEIFGYLGTLISLAPIRALAKEQATQILGEGGELDVVDSTLSYLASSEAPRVGGKAGADTAFNALRDAARGMAFSAVNAGAHSYETINGEERVAALILAPEVNWMIAASRPKDVALHSIEVLKKRVALMAVLAALLAGLVALGLARTISQPIEQLARSVRRSMGGTASIQMPAARAPGEVGELMSAFNALSEDLRKRRDDTRRDSLVQLRLARFLPPSILRDVLTQEREVRARAKNEEVSLIYADLAGASSVDQSAPREQLVSLLGEFFASSCSAIEAQGGRIDRYSGAAVIGVFNAGSREERAQAAMRAAKEIIAGAAAIAGRYTLEPRWVAASVVSGQGMITFVSEEEVSVLGDLVELAAQLQAAATPGSIATDENTQRTLGEGNKASS